MVKQCLCHQRTALLAVPLLLSEPSNVSIRQAAGLLPPLFEDDIYFSSINVLVGSQTSAGSAFMEQNACIEAIFTAPAGKPL